MGACKLQRKRQPRTQAAAGLDVYIASLLFFFGCWLLALAVGSAMCLRLVRASRIKPRCARPAPSRLRVAYAPLKSA